jgi:NAD(P)-dependent dehydrogenase (short-subunit alcohol dehydrogenase family)
MKTLQDKVAVVTGASRGAGRAIARVLGERGATVYVTGRTTRGSAAPDGMPGTIEDTADEVTALGGRGIAVRCDHTDDTDVQALFARVAGEQGRVDLLVNNAWSGYEGHSGGLPMDPFWTLSPTYWDSMFTTGVRGALVASSLAAPMMAAAGRGLIVNTIAWLEGGYLGHLYYDLAKAALVRMAFGMATELRGHGVAAVALAPGWMRTERVMAAHAVAGFDLSPTETPAYLGRAIAALAEDEQVMRWSGQVLAVGALAREYGFTDVDGTQPEVFRVAA